MNNKFATIPTVSSEKLKLRPFTLADAGEVQRMAGNIKIAHTTGTVPHPYLDGMAEDWISKHLESFKNKNWLITWAIEDKKSEKLVGCISFSNNALHKKAEVGYWVGEEFWGQGIGSEAAQIGIDFIFKNSDLNKIISRHMASNPASGRIMQKAGMTQEGVLRQEMFRNGEFNDMIVYGLLRSEFRSR